METSSKLYEDKQATIKRVLADRITPQARYINVLITDIHEIHICKTFYMVDTISNMHLSDLDSKPHVRKVSNI